MYCCFIKIALKRFFLFVKKILGYINSIIIGYIINIITISSVVIIVAISNWYEAIGVVMMIIIMMMMAP
jgi:hypothetical protein